MILRKINAVLALITSLFLLDHAIFYTICMISSVVLSNGTVTMKVGTIPWILMALVGLHAVFSIAIAVISRRREKACAVKRYPKQNISTYVQRITGVLMVFLIAVHLMGAANFFRPAFLHAVLHPLFFATALAHVAVSVSKALITLGIGSAKAVRVVDITMYILCFVIFVASTLGFNLCLFIGV